MRRRGWTPVFKDEQEGQLLTIALVAGEVEPSWPETPLTDELREEIEALMGAGAGRAYHRFAAERRAAARLARETKTVRRQVPKVGRNDPCPCGSGRKYKQCCGAPGRAEH
jgi:uncharacterized protein